MLRAFKALLWGLAYTKFAWMICKGRGGEVPGANDNFVRAVCCVSGPSMVILRGRPASAGFSFMPFARILYVRAHVLGVQPGRLHESAASSQHRWLPQHQQIQLFCLLPRTDAVCTSRL